MPARLVFAIMTNRPEAGPPGSQRSRLMAGDKVTRFSQDGLGPFLPAPLLRLGTAGTEGTALRHVDGAGDLAL